MDDSRHGPAQVPTQSAADAVRAPVAADATALNASDDAQSIIDGVISEVDAMNSIAEQATKPQEANVATNDFSELEKQIQMLLSGQGTEQAEPAAAPTPVKSKPIAESAIEQPTTDPLIQEIDAALADDADSLLKSSGGDIDGALRSVFDERALSGQEEEINRALIEAFGTSRIEKPSFATNGNVTNPLSDFDGPSRKVSPDVPREDKDRVQPAPAPVVAAAAVDEVAAPIAPQVPSSAAPTAAVVEPVKSPVTEPAAQATAQATRLDSPVVGAPTKPAAAPAANPTANAAPEAPHTSMLDVVVRIVSIPAQILAAPMHALPGMGKVIVGLLAVTLVLWTPVAWWLAIRATQTPAVGPIVVKPAPKVEEKPAESHDSGGGGHAAPAAASHGSPAPAAASHGGGEHH